MVEVIVVGGGLAGMSTAALLAQSGYRVTLLEKMAQLGGRCLMTEKDGFRLNFGAHAVYGRDRSYLQQVMTRLGIGLRWVDMNPRKVRYELPDHELTLAPITVRGIRSSRLLPRLRDKAQFVQALASIALLPAEETEGRTLSEWLDERTWSPAVKHFLLQLAGTNFFTSEPQQLDAREFLAYYKRIFRSSHPVSYVEGGWGRLTEGLERTLHTLGVVVETKSPVSGLWLEEGRIVGVEARKKRYRADQIVFCIPPSALAKLAEGTPIREMLLPYAEAASGTVMIYDIALRRRLRTDISYLTDASHRMFVTDPSAYDPGCAPAGGQLLQAIVYTSRQEGADPAALDSLREQVEAFYDRHFSGWREEKVFTRTIEQATVQAIPPLKGRQRMPIRLTGLPGCTFAGDWCASEGSVSDVAFHSALEAVRAVMADTAAAAGPASGLSALGV